MSVSRQRPIEREEATTHPAGSRKARARTNDEPLQALVAGDVASWVSAMAAVLPEAGYHATCAARPLEVAERALANRRRPGHSPLDLIVFVLSPEAWTYVSLIEVLVHECGPTPLVAYTAGATRFRKRLQALGVPVMERLPFAAQERDQARGAAPQGALCLESAG